MISDKTLIGGVFNLEFRDAGGDIIHTLSAANRVSSEGFDALWATMTTTPVVGGGSWYAGLLLYSSGDYEHDNYVWADFMDSGDYWRNVWDPSLGSRINTMKAFAQVTWSGQSGGGITGNMVWPAGVAFGVLGHNTVKGIFITNASNSADSASHSLWCTAPTSAVTIAAVASGVVVSGSYVLTTSATVI